MEQKIKTGYYWNLKKGDTVYVVYPKTGEIKTTTVSKIEEFTAGGTETVVKRIYFTDSSLRVVSASRRTTDAPDYNYLPVAHISLSQENADKALTKLHEWYQEQIKLDTLMASQIKVPEFADDVKLSIVKIYIQTIVQQADHEYKCGDNEDEDVYNMYKEIASLLEENTFASLCSAVSKRIGELEEVYNWGGSSDAELRPWEFLAVFIQKLNNK